MPSLRVSLLMVAFAAALPAQSPAELFARSVTAGVDSPAGVELRRQAAAAVPLLIERMAQQKDADASERAIEHLMRMGALAAPAVPALLELLRGSDRECVFAVVALGEIVPFVPARAAIDRALLDCQAARASVPGLPLQIARAWSRAQLPATTDLVVLEQALRGDNPFLVELACQQLCELGPTAKPLLPLLGELADRPFVAATIAPRERPDARFPVGADWTLRVHDALFTAVQQIGPDHAANVPLVAERLGRATPQEQVRLLQQLGRFGALARTQVHLVAALTKGAAPVAREAATTLGMIGAGSDEARTALTELATATDAQTAARAKAALRQLDAAARPR